MLGTDSVLAADTDAALARARVVCGSGALGLGAILLLAVAAVAGGEEGEEGGDDCAGDGCVVSYTAHACVVGGGDGALGDDAVVVGVRAFRAMGVVDAADMVEAHHHRREKEEDTHVELMDHVDETAFASALGIDGPPHGLHASAP